MIEVIPPTYGEISLEENLSIFVEEGIKVVFISGGDLFHLNEFNIRRIAEKYRKAGIKVYAGHGPGGNLASLNEEERRKAVNLNREAIRKLKLMGAEIMVFHGGVVDREEQIPIAREALIRSISELLETAEENGVKLALENDSIKGRRRFGEKSIRWWRKFIGYRVFPGPLLPSAKEVREVIDELNSPFLGACFDTGHGNIYAEVGDQIKILGEKLITIHMQDNEGRADQHMQPPYGTVDWEDFGNALREIGYRNPILIESGPRGDVSFTRMIKECKALLNDIGLNTGTPYTFRVSKILFGRELDIRIVCPHCSHYILYDGQECSCVCRKWAIINK